MNKIKNKKLYLSGLLMLVLLGVFSLTKISNAGVLDLVMNPIDTVVTTFVGGLVQIIVFVMGMIISVVIWAVIHIASYNNFINETPIVNAWIIVRDFCNMLFILVLLVVAFSTILRVESYNAKKLLPKLLIMAVLINFSRTICGLIIDASQVVMLTFINAIGQAGGNFVNTLGVQSYLNMAKQDIWKGEINLISTVGGLILGVVFLVIAATVMSAFLAVLVMRIVMIWIYVVLSPLAFILATFPGGQKYASEWWNDFINSVVSGPILAFFLWLALVSSTQITSIGGDGSGAKQCFGPAEILCTDKFINFVVAIGMLVGGLMITQKLGGTVSKAASFGENWSKKGLKLGGAAAIGTAAWSARKIKASDGKFGGLELNPVNIYKGIKEGFAEKKRKEIAEGNSKSANALREGGGVGLIKGLGASKDMTEAMAKGWFGIKGMKMAHDTYKAPERRLELSKKEEERDNLEKSINSKPYASEMPGIRELISLEEKKKDGTITAEDNKRMINIRTNLNSKLGGISEVDKTKKEVKKSDDDLANKNKEIVDYKKANLIRTPYTFEANMGRKKSVNDVLSKIGANDNSDDLVDMWRHAKESGDKELAAAVFLAAAKNGHSNEIVMAEKGISDKHGFKGNVYDTNQDGLNAFVNEQLIGVLGMAEQEALDYQSQFSSICKSVGHYNFAESVTSKNGMLKQNTAEDQENHSRSEGRKSDVEKYTRDRNRFGYGFERDEGDGKRKFMFSRIGLAAVTENASMIELEIGKERFNKNAAMKMLDDMKTLKAYIKATGKSTYSAKGKDDKGKETIIEKSWDELLKKMEQYGEAAKESVAPTSKSAAESVLSDRYKKAA